MPEPKQIAMSQNELTLIIQKVVREELDNHDHTCRFNVEDKDVKEFGHFVGMMGDVGNESVAKGIEVMRANHVWIQNQRKHAERIHWAFTLVIISTITGGVLTALYQGLKSLLTKI